MTTEHLSILLCIVICLCGCADAPNNGTAVSENTSQSKTGESSVEQQPGSVTQADTNTVSPYKEVKPKDNDGQGCAKE